MESPQVGCGIHVDNRQNNPALPEHLLSVRHYFNGRTLYDDMIADIEAALHDISIEMYIFEDDRLGRRFLDVLCRKATAGCRVQLMYDSLGCIDTPARFFDELRKAGVEVKEFNPIVGGRSLRKWWTIDRRNHRKLLVIDNRIAYLGGINIAAYLLDWEDAHVRLEGRLARWARASFDLVWRGHFPRLALRRGRERMLYKYRTLLLDGFPAPNFSQIKQAHLHLFSRAREQIRIAHAYFIPDRKVIRSLRRAIRRGVDVQVLVPQSSDVSMADWALGHVLARLLRVGVQVRLLTAPMMHTKAVTADDRYLLLGSANLNRNSFFRNLEIVCWSSEARLVDPVNARFDQLWEQACPYTLAHHSRRALWKRFRSWMAYRLQFLMPANQAW